ncbi:unnamed protein product [Mytilus edulis]|uniref:C1q domain-containing protein n=1 Tax=Mytilus edulis TaxID=6550 RepID=A0A8S3U2U7_MYTED|nr:unnamed protein product [Mytilus edulis]
MGAYTSILVYILLVSGMALSKFIDNPETVPGKTIVEDIALLRKQVAVQSKELASQRKIIEKLENVVVKLVENNGMDITNMVEDFEINPKLKKKGFERNSSFDGRNENESLNEDFDVQGNMRQKRLAISGNICLKSRHSQSIYIEIVKDGTRIADTYCQGDDLYDTSGTMSVVHLNIGDAVWVRPYNIDGPGFHLGGKSSFSGFLTGYVTERP